MFSWLKKHFVPHGGNDHRPHILRDRSIRTIVILILFVEAFTFLIPTLTRINQTGGMAAVLPAVLADLTNQERQSESLNTLTVNPLLNEAAQMKATDMATKGYFAHTSPEGKTPWYWLEQVGYNYQYAGENLAINFSDSKDVTAAWMASPTHRANIVKGNYTEIGTGVATGIYQGQETIFVAQVYANPLPKSKTVTASIPAPQPKPQPIKTAAAISNAEVKVLGAETTSPSIPATATPQNPTYAQKLIASPRNTANLFLYIIYSIVFLALLIYLLMRARKHHMDLITNGLIVIALIGAILSVNYYISHKDMLVTQSFDYSNVSK